MIDALQLKIEGDELPTELAEYSKLYEQVEGGFALRVKDVEDTAGLRSTVQREREQRKQLEAALKPWKSLGADPDAVKEALGASDELATLRQQLEANDGKLKDMLPKQQHEVALSKLAEKYTGQIETLTGELTAMKRSTARAAFERQARDVITAPEINGIPEILMPVIRERVQEIERDGALAFAIVDKDGEQRYNGKGEPMTVADLAAELRESEIYGPAFHASGQTGGGTPSVNGNGAGSPVAGRARSKMTMAEKVAYIGTHGQDKFLALPD